MADTPNEERDHKELLLLLLLLGRTRRQLISAGVYFVWDTSTKRYWDLRAQTIIAPNQLRAWVDSAILKTEGRITELTKRLVAGKVSFPEWATATQAEIKAMHTGLAEIAIGGRTQWTATEAGRLGRRLRMLFDKLTGLGLEWEQGGVSEGEMLARIGMAVQAGRGTYEGLFRGMMGDIGMSEEMRMLHAAAHCEDCPPISGFWAPFGSLPGIGDSACLSNCACTFEYR